MFNISITTGRRITAVAFWVGLVAGAVKIVTVDYCPVGLLVPFATGAISAICVATILALVKRY